MKNDRGQEAIQAAALKRVESHRSEIKRSVEMVQSQQSLRADDRNRAVKRVASQLGVDEATASQVVNYADPHTLGLSKAQVAKAESLQGKTVDYLGAVWLEAGARVRRAVGRIIARTGSPIGTGFLVSPRLILTNRHVIPKVADAGEMLFQLDYEVPLGAPMPAPIRFEFKPEQFWIADEIENLDYALVAIGTCLDGEIDITSYGACPLSASSTKHSVGELVNIIQHPDGDVKQVVVRDNRIVNRGDFVLHYLTDTEGGSSGSPVFNDDWQVVALHHWGSPYREMEDPRGRPLGLHMNEGIRISAIVKDLNEKARTLDADRQALLQAALTETRTVEFGTRRVQESVTSAHSLYPARPPKTMNPNPFSLFAERAEAITDGRAVNQDYSDRTGYDPDFLPGFTLPMPQLSAQQLTVAARVEGAPTTNPFELRYHHFSIVMNAARRMPFFTICNIDGARHMSFDWEKGVIKDGPEAAEAKENWIPDRRIPLRAQLSDEIYDRLRKAHFIPLGGRNKEFFSRGHMTRREDPIWGSPSMALPANADTFHHTNGCPQPQVAFNGSHKVWLGLEDYVIRNTDRENERVTVITGPIFDESDRVYHDEFEGPIAIPQQFFKVAVRLTPDGLQVIPLLAKVDAEVMDKLMSIRRDDQEFVEVWPWPEKVSTQYQSSIAEIESLTGLDFGDLKRAKNAFGDGTDEVTSFESILPVRRRAGEGFGKFESIEDFLEAYNVEDLEVPGAERRSKRKKKKRTVVEVESEVVKLLPDDLKGSKHQQFHVKITQDLEIEPESARQKVAAELEAAVQSKTPVFVAVRFGDSLGIADRIPGLQLGTKLKIRGEWISAETAYSVGGEQVPVLHFTHDPLGFVCLGTPETCYD